MGTATVKSSVHVDAPIGPIIDPLTARYQNMPENPNAAVLMRGAIMSDD